MRSIAVGVSTYHDEARRLRALANVDGLTVAFSPHAEQKMKLNGLTRVDVLSILQICSVIRCELHCLEWRWTARGRTCDGETVEIVCVAKEELIRIDVITVWAKTWRT
jgi:hypothetical protein